MTGHYQECERTLLEVVQAMEAALKCASAEDAPPLPPLSSQRKVVTSAAAAAAQSSSMPFHFPSSSAAANTGSATTTTTTDVDTAVQRREEWERKMREKLLQHSDRVQDACANLHELLGGLSEFCLDEQMCRDEHRGMVAETAHLEQYIVELYQAAARREEQLFNALKRSATAGNSQNATNG